jgi:hypothetical protein
MFIEGLQDLILLFKIPWARGRNSSKFRANYGTFRQKGSPDLFCSHLVFPPNRTKPVDHILQMCSK